MRFFHVMFSWELITLIAAFALLVYIRSQEKMKKGWLTFISWVIITLATLFLICSICFSIKYRFMGKERYMMIDEKMMLDKDMMPEHKMDQQENDSGY